MTTRIDTTAIRGAGAGVLIGDATRGDSSVPQTYRLTLVALDAPTEEPLIFPANPEGDLESFMPVWAPRNEAGNPQPAHDWTHNEAKTVAFQVELYNRDVPGDLEFFLYRLSQWAIRPTDLTQRPTRVLLSMGSRSMTGIISQCDIERTRIDPSGNAIGALVQLTITENESLR